MKAYLHVASGKTFSGELAAPLEEKVSGEVFFTGMTGYQEVLTDPSYKTKSSFLRTR